MPTQSRGRAGELMGDFSRYPKTLTPALSQRE